MKMAKATDDDLKAACDLANAMECFERHRQFPYVPDDTAEQSESFDINDPKDCAKAMRLLVDIARKGSLFRAVMGMSVICDPANKILDPTADHLDIHPDTKAALADSSRLDWLLDQLERVRSDMGDSREPEPAVTREWIDQQSTGTSSGMPG